ncbi:hypothetical protein EWM64_g2905 [Hericium alpestre]|uniref:Uncharacterized protein n=1 Tax=Hericium alpestre TaxID=135208 RepID=A0A4Z0A613_9AGAM|nr:hypothetical protein EWM64_g2905 [Hericium alpestre]
MSSSKSVLITGCSIGGIGHALAIEFASKGYRVFATVPDISTVRDLAGTAGLEVLVLDVTNVNVIRQTRDRVAEMTGGKLDFLVNNAGSAYTVPTTDLDIDDVKRLFDVNLFSVMAMVKEFVHLLIASGDGRIVNLGSISSLVPTPFGAVFNASKAALAAYGETLRLELAPFNIKVITIISGAVKNKVTQTRRELPPDSLFLPIADAYERRLSASQGAYLVSPMFDY